MLFRVIYASRASHDLSVDELSHLLKTSRVNNERDAVSGMLIYCERSFLQVLEGEVNKLDALYERITLDPRHHQLRLLRREPMLSRRFHDWSMAFEHLDGRQLAERLPGYWLPADAPLASADLVTSAAMAEMIFSRFHKPRGVTTTLPDSGG